MRQDVLAIIAAALITSPAAAQVCVHIDPSTDALKDQDRSGALAVAKAAFRKGGETVVEAPCDKQYTITNSKLGDKIYIAVSGPKGSRDGKALNMNELGDVYQQLIASLLSGESIADSTTRHNVTGPNKHRRTKAETLIHGSYLTLGL